MTIINNGGKFNRLLKRNHNHTVFTCCNASNMENTGVMPAVTDARQKPLEPM
jgi:hypothetical protein